MDELQPDDPTRMGPFRLVVRLGAGGTGQVYLGRDIGGRQAAVKVVHPGNAADPEFRDRFAREIATARSVDSPWTAAVVAADPHAPQPWLATEYVAGPDLAAAVAASGPLPERAATVLASRLAQALAHLHTVPIAHPYPNELALAPDGSTLYVTSEAGLTVVPIEGGGG